MSFKIPTIAEESLAIQLGFVHPDTTPTDAQRKEAARLVDTMPVFQRTTYFVLLEIITKRDNPKTPFNERYDAFMNIAQQDFLRVIMDVQHLTNTDEQTTKNTKL